MDKQKFYDVHLHAFTLGHISIISFINRFIFGYKLNFSDIANFNLSKIICKLLSKNDTNNTNKNENKKKPISLFLKITLFVTVALLLTLCIGGGICFGIYFFKHSKEAIEITIALSIVIGFFVAIAIFFILLGIALSIRYIFGKFCSFQSKTKQTVDGMLNVLSVVENDIGSQFIVLEKDYLMMNSKLKKLIKRYPDDMEIVKEKWGSKPVDLPINKQIYNKVILTPLLMDFGYKEFRHLRGIHYNQTPNKPIVKQVEDMFYGIKTYVEKSHFNLFEIYPFMGINTRNYELGEEPIRIKMRIISIPNINAVIAQLGNKLIGFSKKDFLQKFHLIKSDNTILFFGEMSDIDKAIWNELGKKSIRIKLNSTSKIKKLDTIIEKLSDNVRDGKTTEFKDELPGFNKKYFLRKFHFIKSTNEITLLFFGKMSDIDKTIWNEWCPKYEAIIDQVYQKTKNKKEGNTTIIQLLHKYFGDYTGEYKSFETNFNIQFKPNGTGAYKGNIDNIRSNFFAGIKLYPPLGFDPWPKCDDEELEKVKYLYDFCERKKIPITVHCSTGGFVTVKDDKKYTDPEKWKKVLEKFPKLKLNLAHFAIDHSNGQFHTTKWTKTIINILTKADPNNPNKPNYPNVYGDFSCKGLNPEFYNFLKKDIIDGKIYGPKNDRVATDNEKKRLYEKILFGTDFMVNLFYGLDSYYDYLRFFSVTEKFDKTTKQKFSETNPEKFLFKKIIIVNSR